MKKWIQESIKNADTGFLYSVNPDSTVHTTPVLLDFNRGRAIIYPLRFHDSLIANLSTHPKSSLIIEDQNCRISITGMINWDILSEYPADVVNRWLNRFSFLKDHMALSKKYIPPSSVNSLPVFVPDNIFASKIGNEQVFSYKMELLG